MEHGWHAARPPRRRGAHGGLYRSGGDRDRQRRDPRATHRVSVAAGRSLPAGMGWAAAAATIASVAAPPANSDVRWFSLIRLVVPSSLPKPARCTDIWCRQVGPPISCVRGYLLPRSAHRPAVPLRPSVTGLRPRGSRRRSPLRSRDIAAPNKWAAAGRR